MTETKPGPAQPSEAAVVSPLPSPPASPEKAVSFNVEQDAKQEDSGDVAPDDIEPSLSLANFGKTRSSEAYIDDDASGPAGVLLFHLEVGRDLMVGDRNRYSDPYCIVKVAGSPLWRSRVCMKTLNPVWDQLHTFEGFLRDFASEPLKIRVFDFDMISLNDKLGKCQVSLAELAAGKAGSLKFRDVPLEGAPTGRISFSMSFEHRPVFSLFPGTRRTQSEHRWRPCHP